MAAILPLTRHGADDGGGEETTLDLYVLRLAARDPACREIIEDAVFMILDEVSDLPDLLDVVDFDRIVAAAERIDDLAGEVGFTELGRVAMDLARAAETADLHAAASIAARLNRLAGRAERHLNLPPARMI
ncbi:MAG: hypothetical protein AAGE18_12230 [Pseudomonadota bacterium]